MVPASCCKSGPHGTESQPSEATKTLIRIRSHFYKATVFNNVLYHTPPRVLGTHTHQDQAGPRSHHLPVTRTSCHGCVWSTGEKHWLPINSCDLWSLFLPRVRRHGLGGSSQWQIPLVETFKQCTAFSAPSGLYQLIAMPFGFFSNAYLDDIVIFRYSLGGPSPTSETGLDIHQEGKQKY